MSRPQRDNPRAVLPHPVVQDGEDKGPFDVSETRLDVLANLFAGLDFEVRLSIDTRERVRTEFASFDALLKYRDLPSLTLSRLEIHGKDASAKNSVSITLGGFLSGSISVQAPTLSEANALLAKTMATLRALHSKRTWPHNIFVKGAILVVVYLITFVTLASIFGAMGILTSINTAATSALAAMLTILFYSTYKDTFPNVRFLIGKQRPLRAQPLLVWVGSMVVLPLLLQIFYEFWLRPAIEPTVEHPAVASDIPTSGTPTGPGGAK